MSLSLLSLLQASKSSQEAGRNKGTLGAHAMLSIHCCCPVQ